MTRIKVGSYDIPDIRLYPTLIEATRLIYEKFSSEEAKDQELVAKLLRHKSAKSGSFFAKMSSLRAYGLIERRGIKVTDIGKKLTFPASEQEKSEALKQAVLNIPLWKEFYSRWGGELPNGNFWADLAKIADLEAPEAQRVVETVRKAYLDDVKHLKMIEVPPLTPAPTLPPMLGPTPGAIPTEVLGRFTLKDVGYVDIKDTDTYEIARAYLKVLAKKLGIKEE